MVPVSDATDIGGGMAGFDWSGGPKTLVFLHANGFNAGTYLGLLQPLADEARIVAPDLRGHGATTLAADPSGRRGWSDLRDDVLRLLEQIGGPVVLAGHSMGATVGLLAAARAPERVTRLVMLDPVILPRAAQAMMRLPLVGLLARRHPWVAATHRRRRRFDSPEAAVQAYAGRGAFRDWPRSTVEAYVRHGFRPAADGGIQLAADPAWEASGYGAQANDTWGSLRRLRSPALIVKGEHGSTCAVTEAQARRLANVEVRTLKGGTHFFPLVMPNETQAILREALKAAT